MYLPKQFIITTKAAILPPPPQKNKLFNNYQDLKTIIIQPDGSNRGYAGDVTSSRSLEVKPFLDVMRAIA